MEEKKKRVRPTQAQVKELELKVKVLEGIIEKMKDFETVVRDNEIYTQAMMNFSAMIRAKKEPALLKQGSEKCEQLIELVYNDIKSRWDEDSNALLSSNKALSYSNRALEDEITRIRIREEETHKKYVDVCAENYDLKHRNLIKRIFNI